MNFIHENLAEKKKQQAGSVSLPKKLLNKLTKISNI